MGNNCAQQVGGGIPTYEDTACVDISRSTDCALGDISKPNNQKFLRSHLPEDPGKTILNFIVTNGLKLNEPRSKGQTASNLAYRRCFTSLSMDEDQSKSLNLLISATMADVYKYYHNDTICGKIKRYKDSKLGEERAVTKAAASVPFMTLSVDDSDFENSAYPSRRVCSEKEDFPRLSLSGSLGFDKDTSLRNCSKGDFITLLDEESQKPLTICVLINPYAQPVIHIYSMKPRVEGQKPCSAMRRKYPLPVYRWASVEIEGQFPLPVRYSIFLAEKNDIFQKEPSFVARHSDVGSLEVLVSGRTEKETKMKGCCIINLKDSFLHLTISPGVDPAIFVCLSAIIDEYMKEIILRLLEQRCKTILQALPNDYD
mmetsp:Transcript_12614/g.25250  ORF Transcript_12614/g.25250 Transcript_12614/m.25250 type:complete len:371 (+) Transcript_12614:245-1357(+)|eukprot:CAMPEP_0194335640 /NCGR_PEP_ID=MMETSP0171-20130528/70218_1 /TAXON_ID=218684 /ORGANISM="Corethron pennatum, Strain L29A3" /LENGTH=370 /DNA_ID=CAMNT_0039098813 /DNA_START=192 /DNA_END=1304 /DNA_ORIENTATION=-